MQGQQQPAKQSKPGVAGTRDIHSVADEVRNTLRRNAASLQDLPQADAMPSAEHVELPDKVCCLPLVDIA